MPTGRESRKGNEQTTVSNLWFEQVGMYAY